MHVIPQISTEIVQKTKMSLVSSCAHGKIWTMPSKSLLLTSRIQITASLIVL